MSILVTGGAGYIGSHTLHPLRETGHEPVVYDSLARGRREAARGFPLVEGNLAETAKLAETMRARGVTGVIHFAAFAYVGESMTEAARYFNNNVAGTLSLLEAMREAGVRRIVFSSTCATYGIPGCSPIGEETPQQPVNPYGESKLMVERILDWHGRAHGLSWAALRYFNAAGADPDRGLGERHNPETHLIPLAIEAALGRRPPLDLYGTDYPTPDGTAIRDYVHVLDLADAHVRALGHLGKGGASFAANLGTGRGSSVREVIEVVGRAAGRPVPWNPKPRRPGDPPALVADAAKVRSLLGWNPDRSGLDRIIADALRWHARSGA